MCFFVRFVVSIARPTSYALTYGSRTIWYVYTG